MVLLDIPPRSFCKEVYGILSSSSFPCHIVSTELFAASQYSGHVFLILILLCHAMLNAFYQYWIMTCQFGDTVGHARCAAVYHGLITNIRACVSIEQYNLGVRHFNLMQLGGSKYNHYFTGRSPPEAQ